MDAEAVSLNPAKTPAYPLLLEEKSVPLERVRMPPLEAVLTMALSSCVVPPRSSVVLLVLVRVRVLAAPPRVLAGPPPPTARVPPFRLIPLLIPLLFPERVMVPVPWIPRAKGPERLFVRDPPPRVESSESVLLPAKVVLAITVESSGLAHPPVPKLKARFPLVTVTFPGVE